MPDKIETGIAEFGKQASSGSWFLSTERDIEQHAALLPYSHYLRQAWSEVNLSGVLCVDGRPTVYICGAPTFTAQQKRECHRAAWNQGLVPLLVFVTPGQVEVHSAVKKPEKEPVSSDFFEPELSSLIPTLGNIADALELAKFIRSIETGQFFQDNSRFFPPEEAVDRCLVQNLMHTARRLTETGYIYDEVPRCASQFTGKERDSETGLDYFGARYYASTMGRFTSADPVQIKANRLLNPQRLNLYTYGVNNPLRNVDPDGRDAMVVSFSDYRAQGPLGIHYPFTGHSAVITIDSHGRTRMYEYGRYDKPQEKGIVRRLTVPDVVMKNGKPTDASMKTLFTSVAKSEENYKGNIDAAYFKTTDKQTDSINSYAENRQDQNGDPNRKPYETGFPFGDANNCATFARDATGAGGVDVSNASGDIRPTSTVSDLQSTADEQIEFNAKTQELKRKEHQQ